MRQREEHREEAAKVVKRVCGIIKIDVSTSIDGG